MRIKIFKSKLTPILGSENDTDFGPDPLTHTMRANMLNTAPFLRAADWVIAVSPTAFGDTIAPPELRPRPTILNAHGAARLFSLASSNQLPTRQRRAKCKSFFLNRRTGHFARGLSTGNRPLTTLALDLGPANQDF